jgi:sulfur carrier protein ThiS
MKNDNELIRVTITSFLSPNEPVEGFKIGEPFTYQLAQNTSLGELIQRMFSRKISQVGLIAVNGQIVSEGVILCRGDRIDLYALLDGG